MGKPKPFDAEIQAALDRITPQEVYDWLIERMLNAKALAGAKTGAERKNWVEDVAYYALAASFVSAVDGVKS